MNCEDLFVKTGKKKIHYYANTQYQGNRNKHGNVKKYDKKQELLDKNAQTITYMELTRVEITIKQNISLAQCVRFSDITV